MHPSLERLKQGCNIYLWKQVVVSLTTSLYRSLRCWSNYIEKASVASWHAWGLLLELCRIRVVFPTQLNMSGHDPDNYGVACFEGLWIGDWETRACEGVCAPGSRCSACRVHKPAQHFIPAGWQANNCTDCLHEGDLCVA